MNRVFNFSAGPSMLPLPVLEKAASELVCYGDSGMSVMEMSHRSADYEAILQKAEADLRTGFTASFGGIAIYGKRFLRRRDVDIRAISSKDQKPVDIVQLRIRVGVEVPVMELIQVNKGLWVQLHTLFQVSGFDICIPG